jgi:hypothetical protein
MTLLLAVSILLALSLLFGAIAALLLVPAELIAEASRPDAMPPRRAIRRPSHPVAPAASPGRRAA